MAVLNCVKFVPISSKDEELVKTIAFITKFKNKVEDMRLILAQQYEENPLDINNSLAYGMFNLFAYNAEDALESKANIENALATFEDILESKSDYWLVRICRIRLLLMLPSNYRDSREIINELEWIIDCQHNSIYQSYYIIPYILLAEFYLSIGELESSKKYIEEAEMLQKKPINILADFLVRPIKDFERNLRISRLYKSADKVSYLCQQFFLDIKQ